MYGSWDMEDNTEFFVIFAHFSTFYPTNNPENQNFEKMKKNIWRYHQFTLAYNKWGSYDVWLLRFRVLQRDFFFFAFWAIFCPFSHLTTQKIKFLKKWKKTPGDIIPLNLCTINENHMMYGSRDDAQQTEFVVIWVISCIQLDSNPQPLSSFS